jgi:hypothetical protein
MIVSIRQRGGLFGIDRTVRVDRRRFSLVEGGRHAVGHLTEDQAARVGDLVRLVVATPPVGRRRHKDGPDSMTTEVNIVATPGSVLRLHADDDSPREVWDLVGLLSDVADGESIVT